MKSIMENTVNLVRPIADVQGIPYNVKIRKTPKRVKPAKGCNVAEFNSESQTYICSLSGSECRFTAPNSGMCAKIFSFGPMLNIPKIGDKPIKGR